MASYWRFFFVKTFVCTTSDTFLICRHHKPHKLKLVWFCATQFCTRGDFLVRRIALAPTCWSYLSLDLCRRSGFSSRLVAATCRECVPTFKHFGLWEYIIQRWEGDFPFGLAFTWSLRFGHGKWSLLQVQSFRVFFGLYFWPTSWILLKTIIPLALMASESIAHSAFGLMGY